MSRESERSSAWLERVVWVHEVAGSNPVAPTIFLSASNLKIPRRLFTDLFTITVWFKTGEKFIAWAKGNRKSISSNCPTIFSLLKTIVNKGDFNLFPMIFPVGIGIA